MFPFLRLLTGYLTVSIEGAGAEIVLNRAAARRIRLWGLRYCRGKITGRISTGDFKRLREIRRGTSAHIKIIGKHGLPFKTRRYRRRLGLLIGPVIFFAVLFVLSRFVWSIEVSGNKSISAERLIAACESIGIHRGMAKSRLSPAIDAQKLLLSFPELSWAALNLEGSVLTVNVSEAVSAAPGNDGAEPCDLRASADGIITKIDITAGTPAVRVGDAVRTGDVLVSGIEESSYGTRFIRSQGTVTAKTERTLTISGAYSQTLTVKTGKSRTQSVLTLFGLNIPLFLGSPSGEYQSVTDRSVLTVYGRSLPISLTTRVCEFTEQRDITYSDEQLTEILKKQLEMQKKELGISDYSLISENTEQTGDGLRLTQLIEATENIAESRKILIAEN